MTLPCLTSDLILPVGFVCLPDLWYSDPFLPFGFDIGLSDLLDLSAIVLVTIVFVLSAVSISVLLITSYKRICILSL